MNFRACVIVALYTCCEPNFFSSHNFVIRITRLHRWPTKHHQTSCKKILVNYNADPLVVVGMRRVELTKNWLSRKCYSSSSRTLGQRIREQLQHPSFFRGVST